MSIAALIDDQAAGATFYRADLHLHSYPASHDVTDTTMTPESIVAAAIGSIFGARQHFVRRAKMYGLPGK